MEIMQQYRQITPPGTAKIFEEALRKVVVRKKPKKLGFIGFIHDYTKKDHHDLDLLIFPSEKAKLGEALTELIRIYDDVEKEVKKTNKRYYLVTCPMMTMQQLIYYLASLEEGSAGLIPVHSLFFPDYKSFKRLNPQGFQDSIKNHMNPIHGDFNIIHKLKVLPQKKLDPYFFVLNFELNARIKTFPRHNIRASAEYLFHYLGMRYNIKLSKEVPHNIKNIEKEFINLMKKLDKITYG